VNLSIIPDYKQIRNTPNGIKFVKPEVFPIGINLNEVKCTFPGKLGVLRASPRVETRGLQLQGAAMVHCR
jgi:hypothetical protein